MRGVYLSWPVSPIFRTCISAPMTTRLRDEEQSFNLIEVGKGEATVAMQAWDGGAYRLRVYRDAHWQTATGEQLAEAPEA